MFKNNIILIPNKDKNNEICDFLSQTAKILSQSNKVYVFDINHALSIKKLTIKLLKKEKITRLHKQNNIHYIKPILILPFIRFNFIRKINLQIFFLYFQIKLYLLYPNKIKIIWMFFPQLSYLINLKLQNYKIIYDIVDFYTKNDGFYKNKLKNINQKKSKLLEKSDLICAISESLAKKYRKLTNKKIHIVPQGFDIKNFKNNRSCCLKYLKQYKQLLNNHLTSPIIGFIGKIDHRLDYNLLKTLAQNNQSWTFIIVGPKSNFETFEINIKNKYKEKVSKFLSFKNVYWINKQPKNNIKTIIDNFDICTIPYDMSQDFNKYCYPMKLFEYFYIGKHIISTPITELTKSKFTKLVHIGSNTKEWEDIIIKTINKPLKLKYINKQKNIATKNSWVNKISTILNLLN